MIARRGITLLGVTLANLDDAAALQLELPFRSGAVSPGRRTVDDIRDRWGTAALTRAALLGRGLGESVPLLPD